MVSRCFPGGYHVKLYISRAKLAWWLLAFLCCGVSQQLNAITQFFYNSAGYISLSSPNHWKIIKWLCHGFFVMLCQDISYYQWLAQINIVNSSLSLECSVWVLKHRNTSTQFRGLIPNLWVIRVACDNEGNRLATNVFKTPSDWIHLITYQIGNKI